MKMATVETLLVDFGKHDTHLALEELPTLHLPNLTRLQLTQNTCRDRNVLHQVPSLYPKKMANSSSSGPSLKELCLRQAMWPTSPSANTELEQTLENGKDTLETLRLDILGHSYPFPPPHLLPRYLPQLTRLEHLEIDAGMLWPLLWQRLDPYSWDHFAGAFFPITYGDPITTTDTRLDAVLPRSVKCLRIAHGSTWRRRWDAGRRIKAMLADLARSRRGPRGSGF